MRWWTLLLAILSVAGGAEAEPPAEEDAPRRGSAAARADGTCVEGPHFLVWDEDPTEAAAWAAVLGATSRPRPEPSFPVLCAWCGETCNDATVEGSTGICPGCLATHFGDDARPS